MLDTQRSFSYSPFIGKQVRAWGLAPIGVLACPPRPETGTGSGGATGLEYGVAAAIFRRGVYETPAPEASPPWCLWTRISLLSL